MIQYLSRIKILQYLDESNYCHVLYDINNHNHNDKKIIIH